MAGTPSTLDLPFHPDLRLLAKRDRGVLRQADQAPSQTRCVRLRHRAPNRDQALHGGDQRRSKTFPVDKGSAQNSRRRHKGAPRVRFYPLADLSSSWPAGSLLRFALDDEQAGIGRSLTDGNGIAIGRAAIPTLCVFQAFETNNPYF